MSAVLDIVGAIFLLLGAMLCFAASVGLVRFPDVLTRMHAATKPQTLGLLFVVIGVALSLLLLIARSSRTSVRPLGREPVSLETPVGSGDGGW